MVDEENNQYYSQNNYQNSQQPGYGSVDGVTGRVPPQGQPAPGGYYGTPQPTTSQQPGGTTAQQQVNTSMSQPSNDQSSYRSGGFSNNINSTAQAQPAVSTNQNSFKPASDQILPEPDYSNMFGLQGSGTNSNSPAQPNIWQPKPGSETSHPSANNPIQHPQNSPPIPAIGSPNDSSSQGDTSLKQSNPYERDSVQPHRPVKHKPKSGKKGLHNALSTFLILLIAPLLAFLLMQFVFQTYEVDGPSMESTLSTQDRLIVWKMPKTIAQIRGNDYVPERDDILVFYSNDHRGSWSSERRQLIKRVVGLPGERVVVKNGQITIFNDEFPDGFNPDLENPQDKDILPAAPTDNIDIIIPDDSIYFVGDNRNNSLDSRTFGPVPLDNIVGRLVFRMMPVAEARAF